MTEQNADRALGRLEGKVDLILQAMNAKNVADTARDVRIGSLEKKWSWAAGAGAGLGAITGFMASLFKGHA
jgi:hypothetical protein